MKKYLILFLLLTINSCIDNKAEKETNSTNQKIETLGVRNAHMMTYNSNESKVYLYGGANQEKVLSDLWIFEEKTWKKLDTKISPPARTFGCLAYEEKENRMILFGGSKVLFGNKLNSENLLNDTWQFKNGEWEEIRCTTFPTPRAEAEMIYEKANKRLVLFGGYTIEGDKIIKLGDTWLFENNNWKLKSESGPSKRHGVSMAYYDKNEQIVLFGGSTIDKQYGKGKGETWLWRNNKWEKVNTNEIEGLFNSSIVYHNHKDSFFLFGGWNGEKRINKTMSYSDAEWRELKPQTSPTARNHSRMIYDIKNEKILLFGGHNGKEVFGDTWEFVDNNWQKISGMKPHLRHDNGH